MSIRESYMIKTVIGNTDLTLTAKPGESLLIRDIQIYNPASNYLTISIDKSTVGYFRIGGPLGSHLPFLGGAALHSHDLKTSATAAADQTSFAGLANAGGVEIASKVLGGLTASTNYKRVMQNASIANGNQKTLLGFLAGKDIFKGYPVAEGETITLSGAAQAGAVQMVIYEIYDAGDQKSDSENGAKASSYIYINYGDSGATINATGDTLMSTQITVANFPQFPYSALVPSKHKISILGILASDVAPAANDGTDYCYTRYLKLVKGRVTMFDDDKNGLLLHSGVTTSPGGIDIVAEGCSIIGNYSSIDFRSPLMFASPLEFNDGEELNVYLNTLQGGSGKTISRLLQQIGFITRVEIAA